MKNQKILISLTLIGLFAVPRAIGLGEGYERGYTVGLILTQYKDDVAEINRWLQ